MEESQNNDKPILGFQGQYLWLSNFIGGVEQRYQAAKFTSQEDVDRVLAMSPADAKRYGRRAKLDANWSEVRLTIMENAVRQKMESEPYKSMLLATGERHIEEANYWGDCFWGTFNGVGDNNLGKIIMKIRDEMKGR